MRVAVFGGTGFVGSYVTDALLAAGHEPVLLVRSGSEHKVRQAANCRLVPGDIGNPAAIVSTLRMCEAAIYLIGILREKPRDGITFDKLQYTGARNVIDAAVAQQVPRFLLMSANGVTENGTPYQQTKFAAEKHLAQSGLAWTVFRPSIVFGDPRGRMEFCTQMRDQVIRPPLPAPLFFQGISPARGSFDMSPVWVEDVAQAFVHSLDNAATHARTFELGGTETLSWRETLCRIASACQRDKWFVPVPAAPLSLVAGLLDRFAFFPVTRDQLRMLMEGNVVTSQEAFELLGIAPSSLTAERLGYLRS